jgi:hypothetical protein
MFEKQATLIQRRLCVSIHAGWGCATHFEKKKTRLLLFMLSFLEIPKEVSKRLQFYRSSYILLAK